MTLARLESQALAVPTGGWVFDLLDDDGNHPNVTVAAGTYSPTTLLAAVVAAMNAASAETYTGSLDAGEGGTGCATIATATSALFELTWVDLDLREALGWTGVLDSAVSYTSDVGVKGLWLPDCPTSGTYGAQDPGHTEGGVAQTISALGVTKTWVGPARVRQPGLRWSHVTAARARQAAESGAPRSWERFCREVLRGSLSYFHAGGTVRVIWDTTVPGTYTDYRPSVPRTTELARADATWAGLYAVSFEGWAV